MKINQVYLGLGSNLGNRQENLQLAYQFIQEQIGNITAESSIYETAAWGLTEQNAFLNQVLHIQTQYQAIVVLKKVLDIERSMGRVREIKWGARMIDIDILYYNNDIIEVNNLVVPHPFIHERRFVLVPLCEIASDLVHPKLKQTNKQLLEKCVDSSKVIKT